MMTHAPHYRRLVGFIRNKYPNIPIKEKFTMELVWHNCLTYKPEEKFNPCLYITDGKNFYKVLYKHDIGFMGDGVFVDDTVAAKYWWADILQTIQGSEFKPRTNTSSTKLKQKQFRVPPTPTAAVHVAVRKYNPVEEAYRILTHSHFDNDTDLSGAHIAMEEAIGYLGEALAD